MNDDVISVARVSQGEGRKLIVDNCFEPYPLD